MKEDAVEKRFKERLEDHGFLALKLVTPGYNGTMDRLIHCPMWSPGAPYFCEIKRPRKTERRLQELRREEWRKRGAQVLDVCDTYERVEEVVAQLLNEANERIKRPI